MDWKGRAAAKRAEILSLIPQEWRLHNIPTAEECSDVTGSYIDQFLDDPVEREITTTDAVGIAERIAARKWTALAVTTAFCHRAAIAHQLLNCLHEIFFEAAFADAKELDKYQAGNNGKVIGPLHGVPISLKDQFHVRNVETTMGYVGWIGTFQGKKDDPRRLNFESELVRELRELGAVLFCKTSVPHTLMSGETVNNIIEYTRNPKNRHLSSGGSSGGEGALIGFRGSPLGFGTDIGGSVRIPAGFNGLYGLRPSAGRIPYEGAANSMDGQNSVLSVVGPLATTAQSIKFVTKSILSTQPWLYDPHVIRLPWQADEEKAVNDIVEQSSTPRLAFGIFRSDGIVNAHPPIQRAIDIIVDALRGAGHEVIEWKPPSHRHGHELVVKSWLYDGGKDVVDSFALSGEPSSWQVGITYGETASPQAVASDIMANNIAKRQWQKEYLDYWMSTKSQTKTGRPVDGVISPLAPFAAARRETYQYYQYSTWVNGLDATSVVVPITHADKSIDRYPDNYQPLGKEDQHNFDLYDAEIYHNAPTSLQIVGMRLTEERMIAIAEHVGSLLK